MLPLTVGLAIVTLSLTGQASAATPYCEKVDPSVLIQELEGQINFRDSDLRYRSQVETTDQNGIYRYRYCITNDHSYTPTSVLWRDKIDHTVSVFEGFVAQQAERVQYRDYKLDRGTKTFEILYGPQSEDWEGDKDIDTIYQKQVLNPIRPIVLKVNNYKYADNGSTQQDLDRSSVDAQKNIQLTSGAIIDIPVTISDLRYFSGLEKTSADRTKEATKFVTIDLNFVSALKDGEITNFGTFNSSNPELFQSAETIPNTIVEVEATSKEALGQVKVGPAYQFNSKETGGKWFFSYQKVSGSAHQAVMQVTVTGEGKERIGTFPISVIVPSQ